MSTIVIIIVIVTSLIKILMTCLPLGVVEWIQRKFDIHSPLDEMKVTISVKDQLLEGEQKTEFINRFNQLVFMERQHIYPGNEENFLRRVDTEPPVTIKEIGTKNTVTLFIFQYPDRIDVVKQYKRKLFAYSLYNDRFKINYSS